MTGFLFFRKKIICVYLGVLEATLIDLLNSLKTSVKVQDIKNIYQDYYIQKQYSNPSLKLAPHQTALIPKDCELYQAHAFKEGALLNPSSSF